MSCTEPLSQVQRAYLLDLARRSIRHGLEHGSALPVDLERLDPALRRQQASFVTLEISGTLRGCMGSLEAHRPLAEDVAANAYAAAFRDPRFPPVTTREEPELELHISLLTAPEAMHIESEAELLRQLRPGIDGLILREGAHRGTFLPAVWEDLPFSADFLRHLKAKAGLPSEYWSDSIEVFRYGTEVIE